MTDPNASPDQRFPVCPTPFLECWSRALSLTASELEALIDHAHIRSAWLRNARRDGAT